MTLRRRDAVRPAASQARWFLAACDATFTRNWFDEPLFGSTPAAAKAWPACRRAVWALECRGRVPAAATAFDGLTGLSECLGTVSAARASLERLLRRDPQSSRVIGDYLEIYRRCLDTLDGQVPGAPVEGGDLTYGGVTFAPVW